MLWKVLTITFLVLTNNFGFLFAQYTNNACKRNRIKVIIDTDAGSDDAFAILLTLAAKDTVDVVAITCAYGNTNVTNVEANVLKILTIANRTDIPVYRGASKPFINSYIAGDYFGNDGMGDFYFGRPIEGTIDRSIHAASAMVKIVKNNPGNINILSLGPLTNIATATILDPNFAENVKQFYITGLKTNDVNEGKATEFNFCLDPESDATFLKSLTKKNVLILPVNIVAENPIPMSWRKTRLGRLARSEESNVMKFLNLAEAKKLENHNMWEPSDTVTAAIMIWPELITISSKAHIRMVLCSNDYNGIRAVTCDNDSKSAVVIKFNHLQNNADIVQGFNVEDFKNKLLNYLQ